MVMTAYPGKSGQKENRSRRPDKLHASRGDRSAGQTNVAGQQRSVQHFRKRNVGRIIGAQILPELPNPIQERLVCMALHAEAAKIIKRCRRSRGVKLPFSLVAPKRLYNLHIKKVRGVQSQCRIGNPSRNGVSGRSVEQKLHDGRSVNNDHRESRSARITSAALRFKCLRGRARKRSITSWRVGQSSALPTSRRM